MTWFRTSIESEASVSATREEVWAVLTDPDLLVKLTPFLKKIRTDGDTWRWELARVPILSTAVSPVFTEQMSFTEPSRIEFTHEAPSGVRERAGVEGWYSLQEKGAGTLLGISLGVEVDLPLPALARPAVITGMKGVLAGMGRKFSANLLAHLGAS